MSEIMDERRGGGGGRRGEERDGQTERGVQNVSLLLRIRSNVWEPMYLALPHCVSCGHTWNSCWSKPGSGAICPHPFDTAQSAWWPL